VRIPFDSGVLMISCFAKVLAILPPLTNYLSPALATHPMLSGDLCGSDKLAGNTVGKIRFGKNAVATQTQMVTRDAQLS
jgi:hypothetical protein